MGAQKMQELVSRFKEMFPGYQSEIVRYSGNGDSVRIDLKNRQMLVFSYRGEQDWSLETLKHYAARNA